MSLILWLQAREPQHSFRKSSWCTVTMFASGKKCKSKLEKINTPLAKEIAKNMDELAKGTKYTTGLFKNQEKWPSLFEHGVALSAVFMDPTYFTYLNEEKQMTAKAHLKKLWLRIQEAKRNAETAAEETQDTSAQPQDQDTMNDDHSDSDASSSSEDEFDKSLRLGNMGQATSSVECEISLLLESISLRHLCWTEKKMCLSIGTKRR